MKPTERDDLLIRLDERTRNTWQLTEKIELHQKEQNSHVADHCKILERHSLTIRIYGAIGGSFILLVAGCLVTSFMHLW